MPQEPLAHFSGGPWLKDTVSHYIMHNKETTESAILKIPSLDEKSVSMMPAELGQSFDIMIPYYDDDKLPYMMCHDKDNKKFVFFRVTEGAAGLEEMGSCETEHGFDMVCCFRHPEFDESMYFAYDYDTGHTEYGTINPDHSGLNEYGRKEFGAKFRTITVFYNKKKWPHIIVHSEYGWALAAIKDRADLEASGGHIYNQLTCIDPPDLPVQNASHFFSWMYKKKAYFFAYCEDTGDAVVFKLGKDCCTYQEIWKDNIGESRFNIICPLYIHKQTLFVCGNMCGAGGGECYYYGINGDGLTLEKEEKWENNAWTRFSSFQCPEDDWGDSSDIDSPSD